MTPRVVIAFWLFVVLAILWTPWFFVPAALYLWVATL